MTEQHLIDLQEVFDRLKAAGLKLGPKKCKFARSEREFLGHKISSQGLSPPDDRMKAIMEYPPPKNVRELRRIMGMLTWFQKFIPNFSQTAHPIYKLMKSDVAFVWGPVEQAALDKLKSSLYHSEILAFPRYDLPFRQAVDSSHLGIGYMLYQIHPEEEFPSGTSERERVRVDPFWFKILEKMAEKLWSYKT